MCPQMGCTARKKEQCRNELYMEFMTSYDELNSFARKVESELEQKKKELLYIQHTGNNLQLGNGPGIAENSHVPYPLMFKVKIRQCRLQLK